jgi:shikimate dehydrogenase
VRPLPGRLVLLGHPVAHSLSPAFQNAALRAAKIPLSYEPLDVLSADLSTTLADLVEENAAGNVTIPHKTAVQRACSQLTPEASRVAAVNTFAVRDGTLVGHNTDIAGFDHAARELLGAAPSGLTIGVFGAGGAAAAVLAAIESWEGCSALVVNRDMDRAASLCERFRSFAQPGDTEGIGDRADIVVNATSLGMAADERGPIDPAQLRRATAVLDLVYSPNETAFVRAARQRGIRAADGLSMLLAQGAEAFAWWFGRRPDAEVMWRAVGRSPRAQT